MNLTEFLLARIAEDEAAARSAAPAPWEYQDVESVGGGRICDTTVEIANMFYDPAGERVDPRIRKTVRSEQADLTAEHIVRWDPARVLAECEAKRRIIEWCLTVQTLPDEGWQDEADQVFSVYAVTRAMEALATPYADHPDYDARWTL